MSPVRFIHCADLHLDTPFRGLSHVAPEISRALNDATFQSYDNIVQRAIAEKVDCVVIAGDVYDSAERSLRAQFKFRDGLERLASHGIEVFIACGNHDPLNGWSATITWPESVHTFAGDHVDVRQVVRGGQVVATVCGMSYERESVRENLAVRFPEPAPGPPAIAVLHANVGGDPRHQPYAPTTVEELASKGFDYWALGHVHTHRVLREQEPAIIYPGCAQSRHPNETGPKGCCLVTLTPFELPDIQFIPTDAVRYEQAVLDISEHEAQDSIREAIAARCRSLLESSSGRHAVVRVTLSGRTRLHHELARSGGLEALLEMVREDLSGWQPWAWVEKLVLDTRGMYRIEDQRGREDFVGDLISAYDLLLDPASGHRAERMQAIDDALESWQGYKFLRDEISGVTLTEAEMLALAEQARSMTLDQLVEEL
jgi:DNA repair exonuclease SbcCD nuclease subunit